MKSKRLLIVTVIVIFFSSIIFSQKKDPKQNNNQKDIKDTVIFEKAKKSIYDGNWVFVATRVSKGGLDISSSYSNGYMGVYYGYTGAYYIVIEGDSCHFMLDPRLHTVLQIESNSTDYRNRSCKAEIISIKEDKKGNICQKMALNGSTLRADVDITLRKSGNIAIVDIYPARTKKSDIFRFAGRIIPLAESEYSKK